MPDDYTEEDDIEEMVQELYHENSDPKRHNSKRNCRDGGACHHGCKGSYCFREKYCLPLSDSGLDNAWKPISNPSV